MKLSVVMPCYNEEEVLPFTIKKISEYLDKLILDLVIKEYQIVLVNDGSKDNTWKLIEEYISLSNNIIGIKLSRNVGHQNALLAGLFNTNSTITISIDADLQDDIEVIKDMILEYKNNDCEIVYGVRKKRESDTWFKKTSAEGFYKLMTVLGADIIYNHADYRLMSKKAIEHLKKFEEVNLFLRGIVPMIGYKTTSVYYDRVERFAGESKYPLKKMLAFAWDGITSLSVVPLRLISSIGFLIFLISLFMIFWVFGIKLFTSDVVPGWASTVLPIYFIGGIQLLSLGIIGEYIGKIYKETKKRPRYFIEEIKEYESK